MKREGDRKRKKERDIMRERERLHDGTHILVEGTRRHMESLLGPVEVRATAGQQAYKTTPFSPTSPLF